MSAAPKILKKVLVTAKGGELLRITHTSALMNNIPMTFSLFLPKDCKSNTPVLYWLSGLTCDDTNFSIKAGPMAFAAAEEEGLAIVMPDTSPRAGEGVPNVDSYDLAIGAGFYVDADTTPYDVHFKMYSYVTQELPAYLNEHFGNFLSPTKKSIFGHSMGGHGALTLAFKDPASWKSVSAFSPICNPTACPWGEKAFTAYFGAVDKGLSHDATELLKSSAPGEMSKYYDEVLIDQGSADEFLDSGQLKPESIVAAAESAKLNVTVNMREGFDHSYYFIAAFVQDHVRFHAERLNCSEP
eukprot:CAMPEP_0116023910 /NCGR_PEP_ID=MMETSP0321-20121206/11944_1 /TAXON_ID=163516 /ORGANISM="Leptocylindrus danicus var. danicus, Strain B650" /LENGTH=297 /DNA_ID=CAMNT_0003495423 /DNA_START=85 /DNA_END=978 /DNA_ORIENTATION=-